MIFWTLTLAGGRNFQLGGNAGSSIRQTSEGLSMDVLLYLATCSPASPVVPPSSFGRRNYQKELCTLTEKNILAQLLIHDATREWALSGNRRMFDC